MWFVHVFEPSGTWAIRFRCKRSGNRNFLHLPELENAKNRKNRVLVLLATRGFPLLFGLSDLPLHYKSDSDDK